MKPLITLLPDEKIMAKKMAVKGYLYVILFDEKDDIEPLYTKTLQDAINLVRDYYKDKKKYRIEFVV